MDMEEYHAGVIESTEKQEKGSQTKMYWKDCGRWKRLFHAGCNCIPCVILAFYLSTVHGRGHRACPVGRARDRRSAADRVTLVRFKLFLNRGLQHRYLYGLFQLSGGHCSDNENRHYSTNDFYGLKCDKTPCQIQESLYCFFLPPPA